MTSRVVPLQHRPRRNLLCARAVPPGPQRFLEDAFILMLFLPADATQVLSAGHDGPPYAAAVRSPAARHNLRTTMLRSS